MNATTPSAEQIVNAPAVDENQLIAERRNKLTELRKAGPAFPNDYVPTHRAGELHAKFEKTSKEELEALNLTVSVSGRMMLKRVMGKASFATVKDATGSLQFFINDQGVSEAIHNAFKHWDMGDYCRHRCIISHKQRRALRALHPPAPIKQKPAPTARQVSWPGRSRNALPPAVCRPDHV